MLSYQEGNSIFHKMHGTIKLIFLLSISIGIFMIKDMQVLHILFAIAWIFLWLTKIKMWEFLNKIKQSMYIVLITFLLNLLFSSISYSFMIAYRIWIMIVFTMVVTITTKSMDLVEAISHILLPLKFVRVNPKEMSVMVSIGIHFMPILKREYLQIKEAQMAKGYRASMKQIKSYCLCLFISYITNCFRRVDEVAMALQVKGFEE